MKCFDYRKFIDKDDCIVPPPQFPDFMSGDIITVDENMRKLLKLTQRVAKSDAPILIMGNSGVGKEVLAEFIHHNSNRWRQPFIKLNCAAIPESLMESEFFGYTSGAFTGASKSGKKGVVELAENGTLFLDEIGEMPLSLQAKLLRVLQDGKFLKVGGEHESKANIRIIAATNKNLKSLMKMNAFREDLYFRLNVIPVHLPALQDRPEDIPLLALYFLDYFNKQYNTCKKLSIHVMKKIIHYSWPGNVRELKNIMERLVLISMQPIITLKDFQYSCFDAEKTDPYTMNFEVEYDIQNKSLNDMVSEYEKNIILQAVKRYGSIRKAAKILKISPSTLSRKLHLYDKM